MPDGGAIETAPERASEDSASSPDGLPITAAQEQFSLGFVRMVAAAARCSVKYHETDYDGVDITIASSAEYEKYYGPEFELQVKCTTQAWRLDDSHLSWRLKEKPFRKLTSPKRYLPAYLGVLVVPSEPELWLDQDDARLITKSRMYWQRAAELGTVDDGAGSKSVKLPRSNLFTAAQLLGIMRDIGERGDF
ncbi:DUF4365 domain-containing protein [Saccharopolyspora shandongensis]|uniref:DUF4365 domain-containing protein n=1 Tax=Saccharopolyspora shandongensis TaxID=418495 RepID=UPI003434131D